MDAVSCRQGALVLTLDRRRHGGEERTPLAGLNCQGHVAGSNRNSDNRRSWNDLEDCRGVIVEESILHHIQDRLPVAVDPARDPDRIPERSVW